MRAPSQESIRKLIKVVNLKQAIKDGTVIQAFRTSRVAPSQHIEIANSKNAATL